MELCIRYSTPGGGTHEHVVNIKDAASEINRMQRLGYQLVEISVAQRYKLSL